MHRIRDGRALLGAALFIFGLVGGLQAQAPEDVEEKSVEQKEERAPGENRWQLLLGVGAGMEHRSFESKTPTSVTDARTGRAVSPTLQSLLGLDLTQVGYPETSFNTDGRKETVFGKFWNDNWSFSGAWIGNDSHITERNHGLLPVGYLRGEHTYNTLVGSVRYTHSFEDFKVYVQGRTAQQNASYKLRQALGYLTGIDQYVAYPFANADTHYWFTEGDLGFTIPVSIVEVSPYFRYRSIRYEQVVAPRYGTVVDQENLIPINPAEVLQAWAYFPTREASSNVYGRSFEKRYDKYAGLNLLFNVARPLKITLDGNRNVTKGRWEASVGVLMFFHPNVGVAANYFYHEPEVQPRVITRGWTVGPVVRLEF
jgi:hypothetical protein